MDDYIMSGFIRLFVETVQSWFDFYPIHITSITFVGFELNAQLSAIDIYSKPNMKICYAIKVINI